MTNLPVIRNMPSGSEWSRAEKCPSSCNLPRVRSESSDAADRGSARHAYLADVSFLMSRGMSRDDARSGALTSVPPDHAEMCADIQLEGLPLGAPYRPEIAYALDVATGNARELGQNIGREYGKLAASESPLTIDVVGLRDGVVEIWDYKSDHDATTPPAEANLQLGAAAVAACAVYGVRRARVGLIYLRDDGTHRIDGPVAWDDLDLEALLWRMQDAVRAVARESPNVAEGQWCRYCPAWNACPAKVALIRAVVGAPESMERKLLALLEQDPADAYRRWQKVREAYRRVEATLHAYARERPIDLGDGTVYGVSQSQRDVVDGAVAYRVLTEKFGADVALAACEQTTSKAAIERAIAGKTGNKAAAMREILASVASAGGLAQRATEQVKEHRRK